MKKFIFLSLLFSFTLFTACEKDSSFEAEIESAETFDGSATDRGHFPGQPREYVAELSMLNMSGVTGEVRIKIFDDEISVKVSADGAEANQVHAQHIHGKENAEENATCPDMTADTDGNGLISVGEGFPFYGGIILPLTEFPTANANGKINYNEKLPWDAVTPISTLDNRVIVLHGLSVNGEYVPSLPIACGELVRIK